MHISSSLSHMSLHGHMLSFITFRTEFQMFPPALRNAEPNCLQVGKVDYA